MKGHEPPNIAAAGIAGLMLITTLWGCPLLLYKQVYSRLGLKLLPISHLLVIAHVRGMICVPLLTAFVGVVAILYGFDTLTSLWKSSHDFKVGVFLALGAYLIVSWGMGMLALESKAKRTE